jgi:uncharacterized membrane protein YqhA
MSGRRLRCRAPRVPTLPLGDAGAPVDSERVHWLVVIHLTFVVSGVLLAAMDWIASRVKAH